MKTLLFFYCYLFLTLTLVAQSKYFEKSWQMTIIQNGQRISLKNDNNYLVAGDMIYDVPNDLWWAFSLTITPNGDIIDTIIYDPMDNYGYALRDLIKTEYGFAGSGWTGTQPPPLMQNFFIQLDVDGNFIDSTHVGTWQQSEALCRTTDHGYLLAGNLYGNSPGNYSLYLLKLDSLGQMMWDTIYAQYDDDYTSFYAIQAAYDGSGYYALGVINTFWGDDDVIILKIADDGTILDERIYATDDKEFSRWFTQTSDSSLVVGYSINGTNPRGGVLKESLITGEILWHKPNMFPIGGRASVIIELPDSNYLIPSGYRKGNPFSGDLDIKVTKVAKDDGHILWERQYKTDNFYNDYIYDVTLTSDGGFFFSGRTESAASANVYLLKTNCMGLLTEPQAAFSATADSEPLVAILHNLSQFVYPDSTDGGHFVWDFGDGTTPQIDNNTFVAHTFPAYGTYTVRLTAVVCSDTSVVEQVVGVFPVGVSPPPLNDQLFKVLPNPSNGSISIDIGENHNNVALTLLSIDGKTMLQTPLQVGLNTLQLGQLPTGIYYYVVSSDHTLLGRDKLVIIK